MTVRPDRFPGESHLDVCDAHYLSAWLQSIEPDPLPPHCKHGPLLSEECPTCANEEKS